MYMQSQICAYYAQVSLNLIVSSFLSVYIFFSPTAWYEAEIGADCPAT